MIRLLERAECLIETGNAEEAVAILRKLETDKDFVAKDGARLAELFGAAFRIMGDANRAAAAYFDAAAKDRFLRAQRWHLSSYLFILHYLQDIDTEALYRELEAYESLFAEVEKFPPQNFSHNKVRIGYLLPTIKKSSLTNFITPLFTLYNRDDFEVYVYTFSTEDDAFSHEVKLNASYFKLLSEESPIEAAKMIYEDEIDILFDLGGHSEGGFTLSVMAYRPAKIQISGIGWPSVVGLSFVDYVLADNILKDGKMRDDVILLPHALCFRPSEELLNARKIPYTIGNNVKLGVFNNFMKITDEMLALWKKILDALPKAALFLQDTAPYQARVDFMLERLKKTGLTSRVMVSAAKKDYLKTLETIDIVLDTFPYTGGNMTATALAVGVPVITLKGERYGSRFSASILSAAGCEEFIAMSKDDYVKKVLQFAADGECLRNLHLKLSDKVRISKLFDEKNYIKNLENAYREITKYF